MPPKKGKKGKKGKGKGKDKKDDSEAKTNADGTPEPTDRETLLQQELDSLTTELTTLKDKVNEYRQENEFLQQEAQKVRTESHEYMSYMEKKTNKRQTTIISLSDHNQKQIQDIKEEKRLMLEEYEAKKAALRAILLEKENILSKIHYDLDGLQEYKNLQSNQLGTIKELEREVMLMRGKHSDAIQQLKARFLREKREFQDESENKINSMAKQANKEAVQCLDEHTQKIKMENRALRHELLLLIRKTRALHEHKARLDDQRRQLLTEQQYAADLRTLRTARQHKVLKSFGMLEEEKGEKTDEKDGRKSQQMHAKA